MDSSPGKKVLVTGGGSGIGAATALLLASHGWAVTICGRRQPALDEVVAQHANHEGGRANPIRPVQLDVGDEAGVVALMREGQFDAVVCAAAVILVQNSFDMSTADFDSVLRTNLTGTYLVCREAMRQMRAGGRRGDIVTLSSLSGIRGMQAKFPGSFSYAASKHAVAGLTEAMATDAKPYGIRLNCVSTGRVDTAMSRQFGGIPPVKPPQIASIIEMLLDAERCGAVTGSNLEVYTNDE
jgi:NAD(P)-dependent dehydrogenase (short-subunit alcohol dehydrogenase family)